MRFSIVIPSYNRPQKLSACLQTLSRLDYPRTDFEVVIANDGSAVPLEPVVAPHVGALRVRLVDLPHGGVSSARNGGAQVATGRYLVFIDDDCICAPNLLRVLERGFSETPQAMLGGRLVNALRDNIYSEMSQAILDMVYAHYNRDPDRARFVAGALLALPLDEYRAMGGCDTRFPAYGGEDRDLCDRWTARGGQIRYLDHAVMHHYHELDLRSYLGMYVCFGRGAYVFHRMRARRGSGTLRTEAGFYFHTSNLLLPIHRFGRRQQPLAAALLVGWFVANACGYTIEMLASSRPGRSRDLSTSSIDGGSSS